MKKIDGNKEYIIEFFNGYEDETIKLNGNDILSQLEKVIEFRGDSSRGYVYSVYQEAIRSLISIPNKYGFDIEEVKE